MSVTGSILSIFMMHLVSFQLPWAGSCTDCVPGNCPVSMGKGVPYLVGSI